ncbi:DegT/DnrJ/EryC1/StrS family aminotransferase [uncultured Enterovirga sp.]|uniref:DegT/DnrJ/EryC1/StrS family aminotransferase n=1 Tax=uncultured Enterovirga sp. TaxID=2026352 RepID=UPI0035CA6C10
MNKAVPPPSLPFIDLAAQRVRLGPAIEEAILRVVRHGAYILGPEVTQVEADLAAFCGAKHVISCSNGTDALSLVLMAKGVGPGHAVFCPSFTYTATAEVVARAGATPVFVDVLEDTFNLDPQSLEAAIRSTRRLDLKPVGVIPVDLFGQSADYGSIAAVCEREGLWMLCDAAQSFGGSYKGRRLGTFGIATTTSFFPAKPLGCYGDGGAIFTEDDDLADELRSLRFHGLSPDRTDHVRIGMTGRLDTIQAAVLIEKLRVFEDEIDARNRIARRYSKELAHVATPPFIRPDCVSSWAQYTIRVRPEQREQLAADLKAQGIPTAIYYAKPLHQQSAYRDYPIGGNGLPVSDMLAREVISLPMHPYLDEAVQDRIVEAVRAASR